MKYKQWMFHVEPAVNVRNDRLCAMAGTRKKQIPAERLLRKRSTLSKRITVSVGCRHLNTRILCLLTVAAKSVGRMIKKCC